LCKVCDFELEITTAWSWEIRSSWRWCGFHCLFVLGLVDPWRWTHWSISFYQHMHMLVKTNRYMKMHGETIKIMNTQSPF